MRTPTIPTWIQFHLLATPVLLAAMALSSGCATTQQTADGWQPEPGFTSLFNGHDLTGWQYVGRDAGVFDGLTQTSDARYTVADGIIKTKDRDRTKEPIRQLSTVATFTGDMVLKLEFRAGVNADSGIFIHGKQLQCRDYLVAGPYYKLQKYKPQEWNEIEIVVKNNLAHCTCNGEVLEEAMPVPASGSIGLEADRGVLEYRHIEVHNGA